MKMHNESMELREVLNGIEEELVYLCEVRGELDPESNKKIEDQIDALMKRKAYAEACMLKVAGKLPRRQLNG